MTLDYLQEKKKEALLTGVRGFVFGIAIQYFLSTFITSILYLELIQTQLLLGNSQIGDILYKYIVSILFSIGINNHNICVTINCSLPMERLIQYIEIIIVGVIGGFSFWNRKIRKGLLLFFIIYSIILVIMSIPIYLRLFSN